MATPEQEQRIREAYDRRYDTPEERAAWSPDKARIALRAWAHKHKWPDTAAVLAELDRRGGFDNLLDFRTVLYQLRCLPALL